MPVDGTKKKCIQKIIDCVQYNADSTCFKCYKGANPLTSVSCPVTPVPLNNGTTINIPNSMYDTIGAC